MYFRIIDYDLCLNYFINTCYSSQNLIYKIWSVSLYVLAEECCDCDEDCFDNDSGQFNFDCPFRHKPVFGEHGVFCVGKSFKLAIALISIQTSNKSSRCRISPDFWDNEAD